MTDVIIDVWSLSTTLWKPIRTCVSARYQYIPFKMSIPKYWCAACAWTANFGTIYMTENSFFSVDLTKNTSKWHVSFIPLIIFIQNIWAASSEFGTNCLCEQRRFRRACASAQSRQNLRCSLTQAVSLKPWNKLDLFWIINNSIFKQLPFSLC